MSFIDTTFEGSFEPELLEDGTEAEFRIESCSVQERKAGLGSNIVARLECLDNDKVDYVYQYVRIPDIDMRESDLRKWNKAVERFNAFLEAFGLTRGEPLEIDEVDGSVSSLVGQTGYAIIGVDSDPMYGTRNTVRSFVVGH